MTSKRRFRRADSNMRKWDWECILGDLKQKRDKHLGRLKKEDQVKLHDDPEKDIYGR